MICEWMDDLKYDDSDEYLRLGENFPEIQTNHREIGQNGFYANIYYLFVIVVTNYMVLCYENFKGTFLFCLFA